MFDDDDVLLADCGHGDQFKRKSGNYARVYKCALTQVTMGRLSDPIGERSGAGPSFRYCSLRMGYPHGD